MLRSASSAQTLRRRCDCSRYQSSAKRSDNPEPKLLEKPLLEKSLRAKSLQARAEYTVALLPEL
jgi:hypothetical protein